MTGWILVLGGNNAVEHLKTEEVSCSKMTIGNAIHCQDSPMRPEMRYSECHHCEDRYGGEEFVVGGC